MARFSALIGLAKAEIRPFSQVMLRLFQGLHDASPIQIFHFTITTSTEPQQARDH